MEFRRKMETPWFAGTPPVESLRVLTSLLADPVRRHGKPKCMLVLDVKRAHFHATATRRVYVELPPEDALAHRKEVVGLLQMSMYGTLDAAFHWEAAYASALTEMGFTRGTASGNHYVDEAREIRGLVHGDDFVFVGFEDDVVALKAEMTRRYPCVATMVGPDAGHEKVVKVLGREVRVTASGAEIEWM